jgi:hypothetical protein
VPSPSFPESDRDPLPKRESYPVGRELLDAALEAAGVEHVDLVYFLRAGVEDWHREGAGAVLTGTFRTATRELGQRIELRVHAIPAEHKVRINAALVPRALDRFAAWIRNAESGNDVWRSTDHELVARWDGKAMQIDER